MRSPGTGLRLACAAAFLTVTAIACSGSGDDAAEASIVALSPVFSQAPDRERALVLEEVARVAETRAEAYSGEDATATIEGDIVTLHYSGIPEDAANAVLTRRGVLDVRRTLLDGNGFVRCQRSDGVEFVVPPTLVNPDPASGQRARCFTQDSVGNPMWETAVIAGIDGQPRSISNASVEPESWLVVEGGEIGLSAQFTEEGRTVLQEITTPLVGYPLGIFLDAELIGAPVIQRPITDGAPVISGFTIEQARIYAAILDGGPLPVDVQLTRGEE